MLWGGIHIAVPRTPVGMGVWLLACSGLPVVTKHRRLCLAGYGRCSVAWGFECWV